MASGVTVNDEVIRVFNDMKVRKSSSTEDVKKRKKAVLFCLSEDKKKIIVEEGKQILVGDIGESVDDPYGCFVKLLPPNDCRYGLYDATYETKESKKEDLVFIFWAPDGAPLKSKMIYASSKDAIKKKFTGIKHEWQVNGLDDIQDRAALAEKLGGNVVVSLEGKPVVLCTREEEAASCQRAHASASLPVRPPPYFSLNVTLTQPDPPLQPDSNLTPPSNLTPTPPPPT
ncbi:hypothetical protein CgunFtcFv8_012399 [Champsocephalus gunnari]|uniref:ADF-H domain-containing protein n=1 Tax=Champsocephalus gunnari TaxID=52237 RepID=A0AAN8D9R5_CHAGU|nr:hypothetical protein CgunFtcFv8_012399 [Champsocephalus gunnari]